MTLETQSRTVGSVKNTPQVFTPTIDLVSLARQSLASPSIAASLDSRTSVLSIYPGQSKILADEDRRFIIRISLTANGKNYRVRMV